MRALPLQALIIGALGACTPQRSARPTDAQVDAPQPAPTSSNASTSPVQRGACPPSVVAAGHSDEECDDARGGGRPIPLPPAELAKLIQRTLDLDALAPYWHSDRPNRDILRIVKTDALSTSPALSMFGSPVVWIERAQADKDKMPAFELTSIQSTPHRVTIHFRYAAEGVIGSVRFQKRHGEWILEEKRVAER